MFIFRLPWASFCFLTQIPAVCTGVNCTFTGNLSLAVTEALHLGTFFFDHKFGVSRIFHSTVLALGAGVWFVPADVDCTTRRAVETSVTEAVAIILGAPLDVLELRASSVRIALENTVGAVLTLGTNILGVLCWTAIGPVAMTMTLVFQASLSVAEIGVRFMALFIHHTVLAGLGALARTMASTSGYFSRSLCRAVIRPITVAVAVVPEAVLVELES